MKPGARAKRYLFTLVFHDPVDNDELGAIGQIAGKAGIGGVFRFGNLPNELGMIGTQDKLITFAQAFNASGRRALAKCEERGGEG